MDQLEQGDKVRTHKGSFSTVYAFGHKTKNIQANFIQLKTVSEDVLELSEYHQVFVGKSLIPTYAKNVKLGDELYIDLEGIFSPVSFISTVTKQGIYNPLTDNGEIVVNGVLASHCNISPSIRIFGYQLASPHFLKYYLMTPGRLMCHVSPDHLCGHKDGRIYYAEMLDSIVIANTHPGYKENGDEYTAYNSFSSAAIIGILVVLIAPLYIIDMVGWTAFAAALFAVIYYKKTKSDRL
jgi:hypothetical protein